MIVNNLKALCERLDLNITEAALICDIPRPTFVRIYHNEVSTISFDSLDAICRGLSKRAGDDINVTDYLYYIEDDKASIAEQALVERYKTRSKERYNRTKRKSAHPDKE